MTRREKLLDRLSKLLALAGSPNLHEAEAAQKQAERLMRKHGLRREDVAARDVGYHEVVVSGRGWSVEWRFRLAAVAARSYGAEAVRVWRGEVAEVRLAGEHADVVRAAKLLRRLFRVVREIHEVAKREVERGSSAVIFLDVELPRKVREESFCDGVVRAVARAIDRSRPPPPSDPAAAEFLQGRPRAPAPAAREVARVTEGSGKDHSARVESRWRPQERVRRPEELDEVWRAFGFYLAERHLEVCPGPTVRVRKE